MSYPENIQVTTDHPGSAAVPAADHPGSAAVPAAEALGVLPVNAAFQVVSYSWYSRGYLPHFSDPCLVQSITFRLCDAVPNFLVTRWQEELNWIEGMAAGDPREVELRKRLAKYEDAGHGACWLSDARIAAIVQEALFHFDGERYRLIAWCIMPNHVHVMIVTLSNTFGAVESAPILSPLSLPGIVHSWKSFTAHKANKIFGIKGHFWAREYHDRFIRDEKHFYACRDYIEDNPVIAGLVTNRTFWQWSSAWGGK